MLRLPRVNGSFRRNPVYGSMAIVYSGSETEPDTMLRWILTDTYETGHGAGSMYGKGVYAVHELSGTKTEQGGYGKYIYKYRINIHGYIIFDRDVCEKVYGRWMQPHEQAQMLRYPREVVAELTKSEVPDGTEFSSDIAMGAVQSIRGLVKGIVYTGRNDGRCVLIYDAATILPLGWKLSRMYGETRNNTWNVFQLTPDIQAAYKERISKIASSSFSASKYEQAEDMKLKFQRDTRGRLEYAGDITLNNFTVKVKLPPNLTVTGNLDLRDTNITSLPYGLKVGGSLNLSGTDITSLPPGLYVGEDLNLIGTKITSLPSDLEVGGDLNLTGASITSLPSGLKVGRSLNLSYTSLTSLPPGLKVGGDLYFSQTNITSLPSDLYVGGYLDLRYTNITSLPPDLKVGRSINLSYTKITSLPPGLKVGGTLNLSQMNITSLPPGLKVGGDLYLNYTNIKSLPSDLKVGGSLNLSDTKITSLPPGLKVGGTLDLSYTKITSLPSDLYVGGTLDLRGLDIKSLPPDLYVGGNIIR